MSLFNNIIEFPSDAFKIVTHFRHPLPQRTDTIGPWLDCLSFLAWLSALTNSALVYLFHPDATAAVKTSAAAAVASSTTVGPIEIEKARMREVLGRTLFIALAASHGFILLRAVVRHVLEHALWYRCAEKRRMDVAAREVKERYFQSIHSGDGCPGAVPVPLDDAAVSAASPSADADADVTTDDHLRVPRPVEEGQRPATPSEGDEFWQFDEGLDEIRKGIKDS